MERVPNDPGPSVCLVDDNAPVRTALRRLLKAAGVAVVTMASAEEFLASGALTPACLVVDAQLTGMSGLALQAELLRRGQPIPVIVTSALDDADVQRAAMANGAVAFLCKPLDVSELLAAIEKAIGRPGGTLASGMRSIRP